MALKKVPKYSWPNSSPRRVYQHRVAPRLALVVVRPRLEERDLLPERALARGVLADLLVEAVLEVALPGLLGREGRRRVLELRLGALGLVAERRVDLALLAELGLEGADAGPQPRRVGAVGQGPAPARLGARLDRGLGALL